MVEDEIMILKVDNIYKTFGSKKVLNGISFSACSGQALGLLGRNGAGKTTTIRTIMDIFQPDKGTILLDDKPFCPSEVQIGYLPEEKGLYAKRTVLEQIMYYGRLRGITKKEAIKNAEFWLKRLGMAEFCKSKVETLSKGNQQKIQLAVALVNNPEIVILDEPFSGLDPVNSKLLQEVVSELIEMNKIVIFSSHQMSYVEEFCKNIVIIDKGSVVLQGNIDDIKRQYGNEKIIIKSTNKSNAEIEEYITKCMKQNVHVNYSDEKGIVLTPKEGNGKKIILQKLLEMEDIELECFKKYEPTLNDIFVEKVGGN